MPLLDVYDTPARWRDAPEGSGFYQAWHQKVCDLVSGADPDPLPEARSRRIAGAQRGARASAEPNGSSPWFDPLTSEADVVAVRQLSWIGFPRESLVQHRDDRAAAFAEGEARMEQQHEYLEWHTYRDDSGRVTKVVFVTESPEYWEVLAATEADVVVSLYQELVSPAVRREDLFTNGAYQPLNRWNTTDGIVHLANLDPGNTLVQGISLAQGGVWMLETPDNYETVVARASHAVDDYLPNDVGAVMRSDFFVTVHDPVGLYIESWDDTGWTKPDGSPVGDYWRIVRGEPGMVLRLEYEVPPEEGFTVGDIRIGGRPVTYGGQLAENIHVSLPVVVARSVS